MYILLYLIYRLRIIIALLFIYYQITHVRIYKTTSLFVTVSPAVISSKIIYTYIYTYTYTLAYIRGPSRDTDPPLRLSAVIHFYVSIYIYKEAKLGEMTGIA